MEIRLRTTGGFKRGYRRKLPSFEQSQFGWWTKFHSRVDPTLRSRTFERSISQIATDVRAARIGWWWMGRSRHVVQVSIPLAETLNLIAPWNDSRDSLPVLTAWCQKHGLRIVEQTERTVMFSDNRTTNFCRGTVTFLPTEVQLRFWSRSGPRLASVINGLGLSLSQASTPLPNPSSSPPRQAVVMKNPA